jgi:hypothetical protein
MRSNSSASAQITRWPPGVLNFRARTHLLLQPILSRRDSGVADSLGPRELDDTRTRAAQASATAFRAGLGLLRSTRRSSSFVAHHIRVATVGWHQAPPCRRAGAYRRDHFPISISASARNAARSSASSALNSPWDSDARLAQE